MKRSGILACTLLFAAYSLSFILPAGCTSLKRSDDAVRIKKEAASKYIIHPKTGKTRNGSTLRGTVVKVQVESVPDSCPLRVGTRFVTHSSVVFLDSMASDEKHIEYIPMEDVELVGLGTNLPLNDYGNINMFETYNDPRSLRNIREVPVDSVVNDTCYSCNCNQFNMPELPGLEISCIKRNFYWFFVELRGGYAVYSDRGAGGLLEGKDGVLGEIVSGVRFGSVRQWGLGISLSSGVKASNQFKLEDIARPVVMLHGRYQSPDEKFLGLCMRPFFYGQFGIAIDKLSLELASFSFNSDCQDNLQVVTDAQRRGEYLDIDWSTPLSYGLGTGVDIPLASFISLSFDLGFRSLAFGESTNILGFRNVPSMRRVNMFLFRFGITI